MLGLSQSKPLLDIGIYRKYNIYHAGCQMHDVNLQSHISSGALDFDGNPTSWNSPPIMSRQIHGYTIPTTTSSCLIRDIGPRMCECFPRWFCLYTIGTSRALFASSIQDVKARCETNFRVALFICGAYSEEMRWALKSFWLPIPPRFPYPTSRGMI